MSSLFCIPLYLGTDRRLTCSEHLHAGHDGKIIFYQSKPGQEQGGSACSVFMGESFAYKTRYVSDVRFWRTAPPLRLAICVGCESVSGIYASQPKNGCKQNTFKLVTLRVPLLQCAQITLWQYVCRFLCVLAGCCSRKNICGGRGPRSLQTCCTITPLQSQNYRKRAATSCNKHRDQSEAKVLKFKFHIFSLLSPTHQKCAEFQTNFLIAVVSFTHMKGLYMS